MIQGYGLTRSYTEKRTDQLSDKDIYPIRVQTLPSVQRRSDILCRLSNLYEISHFFSLCTKRL